MLSYVCSSKNYDIRLTLTYLPKPRRRYGVNKYPTKIANSSSDGDALGRVVALERDYGRLERVVDLRSGGELFVLWFPPTIKPDQNMKNDIQFVEQAKGRPLLQWSGKRPLEGIEYYPSQEKEFYGDKDAKEFSKIFWGDNLQVLAHLLKEYRGKIDLIYIDPPFGTGVDYFKTISLRGQQLKGDYTLFEEKQYANIFEIDYFLQFIYVRLSLMRELLADTGFIFVRFDHHLGHYVKIVLDEVFGQDHFQNEFAINRIKKNITQQGKKSIPTATDSLFLYAKSPKAELSSVYKPLDERKDGYWHGLDSAGIRYPRERVFFGKTMFPPNGRHFTFTQERIDAMAAEGKARLHPKSGKPEYWVEPKSAIALDTNWTDISGYSFTTGYPTENSEPLLERVISTASKEGDLVADFFMGSGTTCAVAQKMGRRWIGCDINLGSVQTTTKRINQIIGSQLQSAKNDQLGDFSGTLGFKVLNVNDYDVFRNELEAKEIVMEVYSVEPIRRSYFDGLLDGNFVKVMPLNRVLNKMDIRTLFKNIGDKIDEFTVKKSSKSGDAVYEQSVIVICSGMELDVLDFLKKENKTGVQIDVRNILTDRKNLTFKQKPEAHVQAKMRGGALEVSIDEFHSPLLMRKLETENDKIINKEHRVRVEDYRQIIESVAIDIDYDGKLFNAEIIDLPKEADLILAKYSWTYEKKGVYTVAVKITDVLGEEYFETFEIKAV
jgi:site-specific DNA-methyltransferase (adenine-specific)/adenine-specific DNA-methyltransferase